MSLSSSDDDEARDGSLRKNAADAAGSGGEDYSDDENGTIITAAGLGDASISTDGSSNTNINSNLLLGQNAASTSLAILTSDRSHASSSDGDNDKNDKDSVGGGGNAQAVGFPGDKIGSSDDEHRTNEDDGSEVEGGARSAGGTLGEGDDGTTGGPMHEQVVERAEEMQSDEDEVDDTVGVGEMKGDAEAGNDDTPSRPLDEMAEAPTDPASKPSPSSSLLQTSPSTPLSSLTAPFSAPDKPMVPPLPPLIVGLTDGTVEVWDVRASRLVRRLDGHSDAVHGVAVSPAGEAFASCSEDCTVAVWDVGTWEVTHRVSGHGNPIFSLCFSPGGDMLLCGCGDSCMRLYNIRMRKMVKKLRGHKGAVFRCRFNADGSRAYSASEDGEVKVWDIDKGLVVSKLKAHTGTVFGLSVSPDPRFIASCSEDTTVRIWDLVTGKSRVLCKHAGDVFSCEYNTDGHALAAASEDHTVGIWPTSLNVPSTQPSASPVEPADNGDLPTTESAATATASEGDNECPTATGDEQAAAGRAEKSTGPDGETSDKAKAVSDGTSVLSERRVILRGHTADVIGCTFAPGGEHVASCSFDRTVRVWNPITGTQVRRLNMAHEPSSCAFLPSLMPSSMEDAAGGGASHSLS